MIKISVIIPTYNGEKVVARAIRSVNNQTGDFDTETLIIDDCSTDKTPNIAEVLGATVLFTEKHTGGPNAGRNIGLKKATGNLICFLDQDDEFLEGKLRTQLSLISDSVLIVFTDYIMMNDIDGSEYIFSDDSEDGWIHYEKNETFLNVLKNSKRENDKPYISTLMFHRNLSGIRFEQSQGWLDLDWRLRLTENRKTARIAEPLVIRHIDENNLSLNPEYRKSCYENSLKTIEKYKRKYPNEVRLARKRINGTYAKYFYRQGQMKEARKYFLKSGLNWKIVAYLLTSYWGANWVKKKYRIFGT